MDQPFGFTSGRAVGVIVSCEGGTFLVESGGLKLIAYDRARKVIKSFHKKHEQFGIGWTKGDHYAFLNWLKAIRSRNRSDLAADILEGHLSSALCHTGMISHRLGRATSGDDIVEHIRGNSLAEKRFKSIKDHLGRNGVDTSKAVVTLGARLTMDPKLERFIGNTPADAMLARQYRKPYVVPAEV